MTIPAESSSRTPGRHATGLMAKFRNRSVAAIAATAILAASSVGSPAVAKEESPQARVWLTTVDQSQLLAEQAPVPFGSAASSHPTIVIDPETTYQTMDGFGASITDSSAAVLSALSPAERDATMRKLFDPEAGIGVSFLRQPMGSSDFTAAAEHYTYDDVPLGETDFGLDKFSIGHDEAQILPLLRQAKKLNPALKIVATPWSPPAWMKTGDSLNGGHPQSRPALRGRLRQLPHPLCDGVHGRGRAHRLSHRAERTPVPEAGWLPGHGHARRRRGQGDLGPRAHAQA